METQNAVMPLVPRQVKVGKRCLVYCGDDRCDCDAGPLGRHMRSMDLLGLPEGVVTAAGHPPYPAASLTDPGIIASMTWDEKRLNHHNGVDYLKDVAKLGFVRFDVLGPASSLDPAHERRLRRKIDMPGSPTRRILYQINVQNRWSPIENLQAHSGESFIVWAAGRAPERAHVVRFREQDGPEGYVLTRGLPDSPDYGEIPFTPTHWRLDSAQGDIVDNLVPPGWYPINGGDRSPPFDGDHIEVGIAEQDEFVYVEVFRGCGQKRPATWLEVDGQIELFWEPTHWRYAPIEF